MSKNSSILNPNAREAMDKFKMEAAGEVGVNLKQGYNGELTSRQAGSIGGQMVKKMIEAYENSLHYIILLKISARGLLFKKVTPAIMCRYENQRLRSASTIEIFSSLTSPRIFITRPGTPATTAPAGTSSITTAPAATTAPCPM